MKIHTVHLKVRGEPMFLKRRLTLYGLRQAGWQMDKNSSWSTLIVTPLKADEKTSRILSDYHQILNTWLLQQSCTIE